jgi:hypothetical protein
MFKPKVFTVGTLFASAFDYRNPERLFLRPECMRDLVNLPARRGHSEALPCVTEG